MHLTTRPLIIFVNFFFQIKSISVARTLRVQGELLCVMAKTRVYRTITTRFKTQSTSSMHSQHTRFLKKYSRLSHEQKAFSGLDLQLQHFLISSAIEGYWDPLHVRNTQTSKNAQCQLKQHTIYGGHDPPLNLSTSFTCNIN